MKNIQQGIIVLICIVTTGCATVFKGYEDSVLLIGAPDSLRVVTGEGVQLRIEDVKTGKIEVLRDGQGNIKAVHRGEEKRIRLRSNREHTLTLKYKEEEKIVTVYPKIGAGWAILNILFGGLPAFFDIYTGNWNHFDDIDATFK
ncbi:MAG: hypothetical protein AB1728_11080 [Bacteroidota bacterium]